MWRIQSHTHCQRSYHAVHCPRGRSSEPKHRNHHCSLCYQSQRLRPGHYHHHIEYHPRLHTGLPAAHHSHEHQFPGADCSHHHQRSQQRPRGYLVLYSRLTMWNLRSHRDWQHGCHDLHRSFSRSHWKHRDRHGHFGERFQPESVRHHHHHPAAHHAAQRHLRLPVKRRR